METVRGSEDQPLGDSYERVLLTWHAFEDTLDNYFAGKVKPEEVGEHLGNHLVTLLPFIEAFLEGQDERDIEVVSTLMRIVLTLHQRPIRECIKVNNFDEDKFSLIEDGDIENTAEDYLEFLEQVEDEYTLEEDSKVNIPRNIYENFKDMLTLNTTALLYKADEEYIKKQERLFRIRNHAIDIGKTAAGVLIGLSAYNLIQRKGKPKK